MASLVYAAPIFLLLSGLEAFALRRLGRRPVRFADFVSGLGCTMLDQIIHAPTVVLFLASYSWIETRHGLFAWSASSVVAWIGVVLVHDIAYFVFHFASHKINVLWAAHVVHHEGEDYNFNVSWRQGAVATFVTYAFYLPLAWLGIPAQMFLLVHVVYQVHQFLVHTELIGRLGPLEWFVATPRIHRLHHGRAAEHLDKNYGGFLCVWDRMFGTFVGEGREPQYGVTEGLRSWSPWFANFHFYGRLIEESRAARGLVAKIRVWLGTPGSLKPRTAAPPPRYDANAPPAQRLYLSVQLALVIALTFVALGIPAFHLPAGGFVLLSLATLPALLDERAWAFHAEVARLACAVAYLTFAGLTDRLPVGVFLAGLAWAIGSGGAWFSLRRWGRLTPGGA